MVRVMAMDIPTLRKLVALDDKDPLSRFALGKKLFEDCRGDRAMLEEAATHLGFANQRAPDHLATYHIYAQTLIALGRSGEAKTVLNNGIARVAAGGAGMGRDLGPAMEELLAGL
jgi:predicted Zn-dependent protease